MQPLKHTGVASVLVDELNAKWTQRRGTSDFCAPLSETRPGRAVKEKEGPEWVVDTQPAHDHCGNGRPGGGPLGEVKQRHCVYPSESNRARFWPVSRTLARHSPIEAPGAQAFVWACVLPLN